MIRLFFLLLFFIVSLSLQAREIIRIMPLGDSITYGEYSESSGGYRGPLWTTLSTQEGYALDFVGGIASGYNYRDTIDSTFDINNEGHKGWQAAWIARPYNLPVWLTNNPPDIVLLHIGTNDVRFFSDTSDSRIADTVRSVEAILDGIYTFDSQIKVVLARIISYDSSSTLNHAVVTEFNRQLAVMAERRIANGDDLEMVDMENGAGIDYSTDMANDLHPNDLGYTKMAKVWADKLITVIPIHRWKLDEITPPFTESMRDANAVCAGECPTVIRGKISNAQRFSDAVTGGLDVNNTSAINWENNASFTIEMWVKTGQSDAVQGDGTPADAIFLGRMNASSSPDWYIGTSQTNGHVIFHLDSIALTGSNDITGDNWHHIACVRDAEHNATSLYVDGVLNDEINGSSVTLSAVSSPLNIGYLNWGTGYEYNGGLDDIKIYGAALRASQIQQHYSRQEQQPPLHITSKAVTFAALDMPYVYDVNSSQDPWVTFSFDNAENWMSINTDSGLITGTADNVGNFDVAVQATDVTEDGIETAIQQYTLKVRDISIFPSTMTHYWKLDEATGPVYTDVYLGADGECTEGCPLASSGKINGAQTFTDTDAGGIDINDSTSFNWTENDSFSISFWMKSNEKGAQKSDGTYDLAVLFGRKSPSTGLLFFIGTDPDTGFVRFYINRGYNNTTGSINVADGTWHHIVCVRDIQHQRSKIYVDGIFDRELATASVAVDGGTAPVNLGYLRNGELLYEYNGELDDIKIFNTALSQAEITEEFQSPAFGIEISKRTDGAEPNQNASFVVKVTPANSTSTAISGNINYSGTAIEGSDYVTGPKRFSIAPGTSETVINLETIDDSLVEGDETVVATISNLSAGNLGTSTASAMIVDNDSYGVEVEPDTNLTTTEAGGEATFTVQLLSEPGDDVRIDLTSSDITEGTVSPAFLTFTASNWQTAQTVTVTGVDDIVKDGNISYSIVLKSTSSDVNYDTINIADVLVTNVDDDTFAVHVTPLFGLKTTEEGGTDTFTVQLTSQPTGDVTIELHSDDTTEGTVSPQTLTFTASNWQTAQTVTVSGVDDSEKDGDKNYKIITSNTVSNDPEYSELDVPDVSVTNIDNETQRFNIAPILYILL